MEKIFLDFGANRLQGLINVFKHKLNINDSWIINSYEPNKKIFEETINAINNPNKPQYQFSKYKNFKLYNLAISDKTTKEEIKNIVSYVNKKDGLKYFGDAGGSTLLENVIWHQKNVEFETAIVETIDVNEILEKLYAEHGENIEIYIKCDIEGYEYKVIKKLISCKHLNKIIKIYIEWHPHFFENEKDKKSDAFDLIKSLFSKNNKLEVLFHT